MLSAIPAVRYNDAEGATHTFAAVSGGLFIEVRPDVTTKSSAYVDVLPIPDLSTDFATPIGSSDEADLFRRMFLQVAKKGELHSRAFRLAIDEGNDGYYRWCDGDRGDYYARAGVQIWSRG